MRHVARFGHAATALAAVAVAALASAGAALAADPMVTRTLTYDCLEKPPSGPSVTLRIDVNTLTVFDEDDGTSGDFEFRLYERLVVTSRKNPAVRYCVIDTGFDIEVPIYSITFGGRMDYPVHLRIDLRNVPKEAVLSDKLFLLELDDLSASDQGDFNPSPEHSATYFTFAADRSGGFLHTPGWWDDRTPQVRDGVPFWLAGDGRGPEVDYRAAVELTALVTGERSIGGSAGGGTAPGGMQMQTPGSLTVAHEPACRDYALRAVEMNRAAQSLGCGFGPPVWSNDHQMHFDWCMKGDNHRLAPQENTGRAQQLDGCRQAKAAPPPAPAAPPPAPADKAVICRRYAQQAIAMVGMAQQMNCAVSGPRWSPDYGAHLA